MKTLTVILQGGFGNQLFQLASALQWRAKYGVRIILDDATGYHADRYKRSCILDRFVDLEELEIERRPWSALMARHAGKLWRMARMGSARWAPAWSDASKGDLERWLGRASGGTRVLDGYWQTGVDTALARSQILPRIRQEWLQARSDSKAWWMPVGGREVVGLHLRLKYSYSSENRFVASLPTVPLAYYESAIRQAKQQLGDPLFVVCADCEVGDEELRSLGAARVVNLTGDRRNEAEDFETLRHCSSLILSNSSFAWWAAVLRHSEGGLTVCPEFERYGQLMAAEKGWVVVRAQETREGLAESRMA